MIDVGSMVLTFGRLHAQCGAQESCANLRNAFFLRSNRGAFAVSGHTKRSDCKPPPAVHASAASRTENVLDVFLRGPFYATALYTHTVGVRATATIPGTHRSATKPILFAHANATRAGTLGSARTADTRDFHIG